MGRTAINAALEKFNDSLSYFVRSRPPPQWRPLGWDSRLVNRFAAAFKRKYKNDLPMNPRAIRRLCERATCALSSAPQTLIKTDSHLRGRRLLRGALRLSLPFHPRPSRESPSGFQDRKSNVHGIVLVGGSTRIPKVIKLVSTSSTARDPTN